MYFYHKMRYDEWLIPSPELASTIILGILLGRKQHRLNGGVGASTASAFWSNRADDGVDLLIKKGLGASSDNGSCCPSTSPHDRTTTDCCAQDSSCSEATPAANPAAYVLRPQAAHLTPSSNFTPCPLRLTSSAVSRK
ncbi:hypothetical protein PRIPAC_85949 [Pristionchus pacificus]|uniref:Uncharacterized protein n=1 Tax=Pristionchus pacificus TaxID=54126 RepID=A0A2A6BS54_PRIPA|nr:hypothetical protein PRIPAC_85949 [Pristionchus pacificus]|eukprot:PDM68633.1 hypothetical protein PRIPAC_46935 [Pristionchus pacificus]